MFSPSKKQYFLYIDVEARVGPNGAGYFISKDFALFLVILEYRLQSIRVPLSFVLISPPRRKRKRESSHDQLACILRRRAGLLRGFAVEARHFSSESKSRYKKHTFGPLPRQFNVFYVQEDS